MPAIESLTSKLTLRIFLMLLEWTAANKQILRLMKRGRDFWSGKKIAVIGPTGSGKDSFLARLNNKDIPRVHANSPMGEKVKSFRVKLALSHHQAINIICRGVVNIGGESDYRDAPDGWLAVCRNADVVFYVMTIDDLVEKRFRNGKRIREDLDWLLIAMPHLKAGALIHVLINKIDERIAAPVDYYKFAQELAQDIASLDKTIKETLHPYEEQYTGATLISMKNKQIYIRGINHVLRAVYSAFEDSKSDKKAA